MFSSRASVPARKALQIALQTNVPTQASRSVILLNHERIGQQRRQYAMRSPRVTRVRKEPRSTVDTIIRKLSALPPLDFWKEHASRAGLGDLTPEVCFDTTRKYLENIFPLNTATIDALHKDFDFDTYTLHHTAIPLLRLSEGISALGLHMLYTASRMGYSASTVSLMRLFTGKNAQKGETYRLLGSHFRNLLDVDRSPDVLTMQGLILTSEGRDTQAINYFHEAIETARVDELEAAEVARSKEGSTQAAAEPAQTNIPQGSTPEIRNPKWTYEGSCHHQRGLILLKQGKRDAAIEAFRIVALELDYPIGYLELARLLPQDSPERETYLLKAAQAGEFQACELLALDTIKKAKRPGLSQAEREDTEKMAFEWALIEPDVEKRKELMTLLGKKAKEARA